MTTKWMVLALVAALAAPAAAAEMSAEQVSRSVEDAFVKHLEAGDVPGILALYTDDAHVIWPGQGEESYDKKTLEPMVRDFVAAMKNGKLTLKKVNARYLGKDYVVNSAHWEETSTGAGGKTETHTLRTTEIYQRKNGKWLFVVDHASMGMPAETAGGETH
ncbi:MAG TPA: SgcJ/EcaC family oxidoreductase [Candidatus Binatia bacterium]|nr:SgcJ/EcaC family oxidoreductase [Candidatus Binatia bacterium]